MSNALRIGYPQQVKASKAKYEADVTPYGAFTEIYDNCIIAKMPDSKIDSSSVIN